MTAPDNNNSPATAGAGKLFDTAMVMIDKLSLSQAHYTRLQRGLFISVALDIILSIALIFVFSGQVHQNTAFRVEQQQQNIALHKALVKSCNDINANKENDIKLWDNILSSSHPKTAAEELALLTKKRLVDIRDQQVNCVKVYGG
jgi:hypothetical protein